MSRSNLTIKILALTTVGSYFAYALYWFIKTIPWIVEISLKPEYYVPATGLRFTNVYSVSLAYLMEYAGFVGLMIRVVAASYALLSAFIILKNEKDVFSAIKNKISRALLLEGVYYLFFIPAIMLLLNFSALPDISNMLLSIVFSTQIILITPLLIKLATKVKDYGSDADKPSLIRWAGLSYVCFVVAVWVTYMLKWREMMAVDPYLFSALSVRILGFLNTVIVQSLAVAFAAVGIILILKKRDLDEAARWMGLSAIFLSLHIIIYVIYVTHVGITRFIQFGELWLIPIIGVGLYLLLKKPTETKI
jgi:cytochrome bd-type quinol oxidase subunit 2